ncbi:putative leucine-rich repeat domain superfamily [Helianthus debilis subsp. tardiflorus]
MTVLRSRKTQPPNVEIEPSTPAKEVEASSSSFHNTHTSDSNLGLRRSARLSLNRTSFNNAAPAAGRGKRKAVNDDLDKESATVRLPLDLDTPVKAPTLDVQDGDVGNRCLRLRSGKKLVKPEAANKNEKETQVEANIAGVSEGCVVIEEEQVPVDCEQMGVGVNGDVKTDRNAFTVEEKGKGKIVEGSSSSDFSVTDYLNDADDLVVGPEEGGLMDTVMAESSNKIDPKERFKNVAKVNASRFAHFSVQEEDEEDADEDELEPQTEPNGDMEDWPGPFSTAMKIIKDRSSNTSTEQAKKSESVPVIWVPKKNNHDRFVNVPPSLEELCMEIMAENVDAITSLESVPDALRHKLTQALCDSRKMNHHFFNLLASRSPSEIRIKDCSWLNEEQFTKTFEAIDASNLTVLQLDQCGRCLPDYVLYDTLTHFPSKLSALTNISLKGACRLSDAGLNALITSASSLRSINLRILPALFKLQHLEVLSISRSETVNDSFITQFVAVQGHKMKELVLADCTKLTDRGLKAIATSCPDLCAIDLTNVCKLTDASLGHLANGCQTIQTMKFCRNTFSDEAVAAYLEARGGSLTELSLNHVDKVGNHTALSLAKHAKKLQCLDLSWCREMTDEGLGLIVDSCCLSLKMLKLFGCTQITNVFTHGHSNENVKIVGLQGSQILKNIVAPDLLPLRYSLV